MNVTEFIGIQISWHYDGERTAYYLIDNHWWRYEGNNLKRVPIDSGTTDMLDYIVKQETSSGS